MSAPVAKHRQEQTSRPAFHKWQSTQYGALLQRELPRVIRDEKQNEHYTDRLEKLCSKARMSREERELADLLTVLIEDFEEKHHNLTPCDPIQIIRELMDARNLKQKDLVDVFGTPSIASEILTGKRRLTVTHIKRLSQKFNVSAQVFLG